MARGGERLEISLFKDVEGLCNVCSENKGAGQFHSYRTVCAFVFEYAKKGFLIKWLISKKKKMIDTAFRKN